jgi:hypothetical protein
MGLVAAGVTAAGLKPVTSDGLPEAIGEVAEQSAEADRFQ